MRVASADTAQRLYGPNGIMLLGQLRRFEHYANAPPWELRVCCLCL